MTVDLITMMFAFDSEMHDSTILVSHSPVFFESVGKHRKATSYVAFLIASSVSMSIIVGLNFENLE
jgi:hypothetical protein